MKSWAAVLLIIALGALIAACSGGDDKTSPQVGTFASSVSLEGCNASSDLSQAADAKTLAPVATPSSTYDGELDREQTQFLASLVTGEVVELSTARRHLPEVVWSPDSCALACEGLVAD